MSVHQALRLAALRGPTMRQLWAVYRQAVGPTATPQGLVEALQEAGIKHPDLSGWLARHERRQAPDLRQRLLTAVVGRGPDPPAQLPGGQRRDEHGLYRDSHVVVALRRQGRGAEATWHVSAGLLLADQTPILRPAALARAVELILSA